jgi:Protein of unknown function (DUF4238)
MLSGLDPLSFLVCDSAAGYLFEFIALQRARVPASRDPTEKMDAVMVKAALRTLDSAGKLPPKPEGFEDILDRMEVAIDPHRSIHAMLSVIAGMSQLFDSIGIGALHNRTDIPFLTSDNPVIWFDPSVAEEEIFAVRHSPKRTSRVALPNNTGAVDLWRLLTESSMSVFSRISRRQFGHFPALPECNPSRGDLISNTVENVIERDFCAFFVPM